MEGREARKARSIELTSRRPAGRKAGAQFQPHHPENRASPKATAAAGR
jgi:hypothetical protein